MSNVKRETITFQRESVGSAANDIIPLIIRNQREIESISPAFADLDFAPNFKHYYTLEEADVVRVFTARLGKTLIGYHILNISPSIRYAATISAFQDIFYIHPAYRGFGGKFLTFCEQRLATDDYVTMIYQNTKTEPHLNFGKLLKRKGYLHIEELWVKKLEPCVD